MAYESQETGVKVRSYALLRRDLISGRVLDDLANEASERSAPLYRDAAP